MRGLLTGPALSPVAALGVEYLRFADNVAKHKHEALEARRHAEVIDYLFKGALVASNGYQEKVLFADRFVVENLDGSIPATNDADVNMDYSEVEWGSAPSEDEMAIMERMLNDSSVTVPAEPDEQEPVSTLAPPRDIPVQDVEQDREWV